MSRICRIVSTFLIVSGFGFLCFYTYMQGADSKFAVLANPSYYVLQNYWYIFLAGIAVLLFSLIGSFFSWFKEIEEKEELLPNAGYASRKDIAEWVGGTSLDTAGTAEEISGKHTARPGENQTELPGEDRTELLGEDQTELPGEDRTELLGEDETELPRGDRTELLGEDQTELPGEDRTKLLREDEIELPGEGRMELLGEDETELLGEDRTEWLGGDQTEWSEEERAEWLGEDRTESSAEEQTDMQEKRD